MNHHPGPVLSLRDISHLRAGAGEFGNTTFREHDHLLLKSLALTLTYSQTQNIYPVHSVCQTLCRLLAAHPISKSSLLRFWQTCICGRYHLTNHDAPQDFWEILVQLLSTFFFYLLFRVKKRVSWNLEWI